MNLKSLTIYFLLCFSVDPGTASSLLKPLQHSFMVPLISSLMFFTTLCVANFDRLVVSSESPALLLPDAILAGLNYLSLILFYLNFKKII